MNYDENINFFVCEICGKTVNVLSHIRMCDSCIDDYAKSYRKAQQLKKGRDLEHEILSTVGA